MGWEAERGGLQDEVEAGRASAPGPRREGHSVGKGGSGYVSAVVALQGASRPTPPGKAPGSPQTGPRRSPPTVCAQRLGTGSPAPRPHDGGSRTAARRVRTCAGIEKRRTLRRRAPAGAEAAGKVLFDHRHHGRLLNLSRSGLAIEIGEAPSFSRRARLRVECPGEEPLDLEVSLIWCRLVGTERQMVGTERQMVGTERQTVGTERQEGDALPRYQVGLACDDPRLRSLGAPPPALGGD